MTAEGAREVMHEVREWWGARVQEAMESREVTIGSGGYVDAQSLADSICRCAVFDGHPNFSVGLPRHASTHLCNTLGSVTLGHRQIMLFQKGLLDPAWAWPKYAMIVDGHLSTFVVSHICQTARSVCSVLLAWTS